MTEEKVNIQALRVQIKLKEKELFKLKLQYSKLYKPPMGKIIIDPPSDYCCKTCYNHSCIFHPSKNARPSMYMNYIHNMMANPGCLSWLPEDKEVTT